MKQRLVIALLTVLVFGAGFLARVLTESGPNIPAPPAPGTEFVRASEPTPAGAKERRAPTFTEKDRARLLERIQRLRPQVDSYRRRIDAIAAEFDRDLVPILTPQQRQKLALEQQHSAARRAKGEREAAQTISLSDEQIFRLQQRPLWNALWNVAINWRLERLTHDFKLDAAQQQKVRELLERRRQKFLDLVDSTTPPSITLSQLAPEAEKLALRPQK